MGLPDHPFLGHIEDRFLNGTKKRASQVLSTSMRSKSDFKNPSNGDIAYDNGIFWTYVDDNGWIKMTSAGDASITIADEAEGTVARVASIMEAVDLAHIKGKDGKCCEGCPACEIEELAKAIRVSRKMEA